MMRVSSRESVPTGGAGKGKGKRLDATKGGAGKLYTATWRSNPNALRIFVQRTTGVAERLAGHRRKNADTVLSVRKENC